MIWRKGLVLGMKKQVEQGEQDTIARVDEPSSIER
jgi:hypothetical protein